MTVSKSISVGTPVRLRGSNQIMTVQSINKKDGQAYCVWHTKMGRTYRDYFAFACLSPANLSLIQAEPGEWTYNQDGVEVWIPFEPREIPKEDEIFQQRLEEFNEAALERETKLKNIIQTQDAYIAKLKSDASKFARFVEMLWQAEGTLSMTYRPGTTNLNEIRLDVSRGRVLQHLVHDQFIKGTMPKFGDLSEKLLRSLEHFLDVNEKTNPNPIEPVKEMVEISFKDTRSLCRCTVGSHCPLGKMGMDEQCSFQEVTEHLASGEVNSPDKYEYRAVFLPAVPK